MGYTTKLANDPYSEFIERSDVLDVRKCFLEILQLLIKLLFSRLCVLHLEKSKNIATLKHVGTIRITYRLRLEDFNRLHMGSDIIRDGLEILQQFLGFVHNGLVL